MMKIIPTLVALAFAVPGLATEHRAASVLWRAVDEFEEAKTDNTMSAALRRPGVAGEVQMNAIYLHPLTEGRATAAFPRQTWRVQGGQRAFLVGHVGIADGFDWHDAEHPADGVRFYVMVNGEEVASLEVKESKWLPFAAPLYEAPEGGGTFEAQITLATDCGPAGNTSYDWAMLGEPVVVEVDGETLKQATPVAGPGGVLVARVEGGEGWVIVEGLDEAGQPIEDADETLDVHPQTGLVSIQFDFSDQDQCTQWQWRAEGCRIADAWGGSWQPRLVLEHVGPTEAVTVAGERLHVRAVVANRGMGTLLPQHEAYVACGDRKQSVERLAPDDTVNVEFDLGRQPVGTSEVQARIGSSIGPPDSPTAAGPASSGAQGSLPPRPEMAELRSVTVPVAIWPPLPRLTQTRPKQARALEVDGNYLLVENPRCRWLIYRGGEVEGALVYAWDDKWKLAGAVSPLVTLYRSPPWPATVPDFPAMEARRGDGGVRLAATMQTGSFRISLAGELADDSPAMRLEVTLQALDPAKVAALWGPAVHAGDCSSKTAKGIAIFPGLEYLYGEERSSSERDLAPPLNRRWAPHKLKVTVPMMLVETREGGPVMALAWDPNQKWDGEHAQPGACFASPDFLSGQDNHLMQLILPSIPDFIEESERVATDPVELQPDKPWTLTQYVVAGCPRPDATAALNWFDDLIGYPEAEDWPRSFEDEIALCRHGFMVSVWNEETQRSLHYVGSGEANAPGFATLLLMDARAVAKGDDRAKVLDRVKLIGDKTLAEAGAAGLASSAACHIMGGEFPYHWGEMPDALAGLKSSAYGAVNSQEEDGGWGYYPDERRSVLGEPGTRTMGIAGRNAYVMAKWVAISGDPVIEEALRKALRHMERYKVPRGAQGWECPILEPDVLASAYAVRAYTWAYMALGEERWLEKARLWARTGIPFQYAWDDGEHPGMRYASIPVFGSTFFRHSWLGLPVQWCGLVYAYGLQELMRFDDDDLWRKQVEGITVSAMYQQWPWDENPDLIGTYPDSFGAWFTRRNPVHINPEDIAVNVLGLRGLDPGLRSVPVKGKGGLIHVTAPCDIEVEANGDAVSLKLHYVREQTVYASIAPVAVRADTTVKVGGEELTEKETLDHGDTGWAHDPALNVLVVGVPTDGDGKAEIVVTGVRRAIPETPKPRTSWEFKHDVEGWVAANACRIKVEDGHLVMTGTGEDPYAMSGPAGINADRHKQFTVRARLTAGEQVGLFWRSTRSTGWGSDKEVQVDLPADGQWHEVTFDLSDHPLWSAKILQIRLDVEGEGVAPGTVLEVDWVRAD